ncbi:1450_t:CDS:2 [Dentiscutata erythropus]|uniref:1450_t:CDS:1 n=1 Tax=Dentiscutata erythropus TaxID=1348616 RepID=A0A9N9AG37_9GLOM|nr:1450_t:CDS:2 [Dentiscutata erythropus]
MKYIATWCLGNKSNILPSIYRWPITKGKLKFDKHYIIYGSLNLDAKALIGVSDTNQIILRVEGAKYSYNFEIIDIVNNERQKLNTQGLKGKVVKHSGYFDNSYSEFCDEPAQISIYSVKDGSLIQKSIDNLNDPWNQGLLFLDNMRFIGSKNEERILFSFYMHGTDQRKFSILNPHNLTNPIDAGELFKSEIENYDRKKTRAIFFDYIIKVENDHLYIENLVDHESWTNYIKSDVQVDAQVNVQDHEFDLLFKNKSFDKLIDSFYEEGSHYKHLEDTRIVECLNKTKSSRPFIFPHIYKITELDTKTVNEKLNDLDERLKNLDIKLNNLIVAH